MTLGGNNRQMDAILKVYNEWFKEIKLTDIMAYDLDVLGLELSVEKKN